MTTYHHILIILNILEIVSIWALFSPETVVSRSVLQTALRFTQLLKYSVMIFFQNVSKVLMPTPLDVGS